MLDDHEALRQLVEIGMRIDSRDLVIGSGGNTSLRAASGIWIKATGERFRDGDASSYVLLDPQSGSCLTPDREPSVERPMHLACHRSRRDVQAVVHCHPPMAIAWAATGDDLRAFTPEMAAHLGASVPVVPFLSPGSEALASSVSRAVAAGANGLVLASHGIVTVGGTIREAFERACVLEAAARIAVFARLMGAGLHLLTEREMASVGGRSYLGAR